MYVRCSSENTMGNYSLKEFTIGGMNMGIIFGDRRPKAECQGMNMKSSNLILIKNMKAKILIICAITVSIFASCNKDTNDRQANSSSNKKKNNISLNNQWKLVRVEDKETSEILEYPSNEFPYIIEFKNNNDVYFLSHCNYSNGNYTVDENGNISFSGFMPGTEMLCPGITYWEDLIIGNFTMNWTYQPLKYIVNSTKLTITCGQTTLVFKKIFQQDNLLSNSEWRIGPDFLGRDETVSEYLFSRESVIFEPWGNFVRFFLDGTFCSFDRQMCGNSCFTTVLGKYSLLENEKLVLSVDSVNFNCTGAGGENKTEIRNGSEITFKILNFSTYGFQLQKE